MRTLLLLIGALVAALAPSAFADVQSAANWARSRGCPASAGRVPLQNSPVLQQAAKRLAGGASLHEAMAQVGYAGSQSSALHLSGGVSDGEVARTLAATYCSIVADPALREIGAERRGREVWMVLAAPVALPAAADAAAVSLRVLELVNAARGSGRRCGAKFFSPVPPLTLDSALTRAALEHARDMAAHGEFDHRGHDGSTPAERVRRAGYGEYALVGENIAAGVLTPNDVTAGWLASPAHCENIMDGRFDQIGIAYAANPNLAAGLYWTQEFAARRRAR